MLKTSINLGGKVLNFSMRYNHMLLVLMPTMYVTNLFSLQATLTRQVITCAKTNQRKPAGGGFGKSSKPAEKDQKASLEGSTVSDQVESSSDFSPPPEFAPSSPSNNSANSPSTSNEALPSVSRDQILATCLQTSALIAVAAVGLHQLAPLIAPAMKDGNADTVQSLLNCESFLLPFMDLFITIYPSTHNFKYKTYNRLLIRCFICMVYILQGLHCRLFKI